MNPLPPALSVPVVYHLQKYEPPSRGRADHFSTTFVFFWRRTLTFALTVELHLYRVILRHCAKYLGQRSFHSKVIVTGHRHKSQAQTRSSHTTDCSEKQDTKLLPIASPNVERFSTLFRGGLSKFATDSYLIFHHTLYAAILYLVKYLCSKNRNAQEVIEANCRVRLGHSKNWFKIFVW